MTTPLHFVSLCCLALLCTSCLPCLFAMVTKEPEPVAQSASSSGVPAPKGKAAAKRNSKTMSMLKVQMAAKPADAQIGLPTSSSQIDVLPGPGQAGEKKNDEAHFYQQLLLGCQSCLLCTR